MKQPRHTLELNQSLDSFEVELIDERVGYLGEVGIGKTELSAWKAAARFGHRLAKEAEIEVKRLEEK